MPHEYIDWYNIKDPHPMALPNLQKIVDYMISEKAITNVQTVSIYGVAKYLGKQHKQATQLLRGRPGFVEVHRDGKFRGYYYDYANFGSHYPANYRDLKRTKVLLSEDLKDSNLEAVATIKQTMENAAKGARNMPTFVMLPDLEGKRETLAVDFVCKPPVDAVADLKYFIEMLKEHGPKEELIMSLMNAGLSVIWSNLKDTK